MSPDSNYTPKHSKAECKELLFDGARYNRLKNDPSSKEVAKEWRRDMEAHGLVAPLPEYRREDYRDKFLPKQFTEQELTIIATVPLSEVEKYYGAGASTGATDTLSKLATERPDYYKQVRAAAILHGKIPNQTVQRTPEPIPSRESEFFTLSDEECDKAGLRRGYRTNAQGHETVKRVIKEVEQKRADAEQLAAKTAAQLERDARIDASTAEFGRLLDFNRDLSAKQRERDAAAIKKTA